MGSHKLPKVKPEVEKEIWKVISGYEDYEISNLSRVRSIKMKTYVDVKKYVTGYPHVYLTNYKTRVRTNLSLHRLLAIAFLPNPNNKPQVNHIDGIKNNSYLSNLEWVTHQENAKHAYSIGLSRIPMLKGEDHGGSKLTEREVIDILKMVLICQIEYRKVCKAFDIDISLVGLIAQGKIWKTQYEEFKRVFLI